MAIMALFDGYTHFVRKKCIKVMGREAQSLRLHTTATVCGVH